MNKTAKEKSKRYGDLKRKRKRRKEEKEKRAKEIQKGTWNEDEWRRRIP